MFVCGSNQFGQLNIDHVCQLPFSEDQQNQSSYITFFKRVSNKDDQSQNEKKESPASDPRFSCAFTWSCCVLNEITHVAVYGFINKPCERTTVSNEPASSLAASEKWIVATDSRRHLWAWSRNKSKAATVVDSNNNTFTEVTAGEMNIIALTDTGSIGKLVEHENSDLLYQPIPLAARIKHVSCGKEHVLASTRIGLVLTWGTGSRGQLGHGTLDSTDKPATVAALEGLTVLKVAAGGWHSLISTDQGDMYAWGWNESGQLGLPSVNLQAERDKETQGEKSQSTGSQENSKCLEARAQKKTCKVPACDDLVNIMPSPALVDLPDCDIDDTFIKVVSCGSRHSAACTEKGELYTWGWNDYGQLGHGDVISRDIPTLVSCFNQKQTYITDIKCGAWNTAVLTTNSIIK